MSEAQEEPVAQELAEPDQVQTDVNGHDQDVVDARRESVSREPPSVAPKPKRPSCKLLFLLSTLKNRSRLFLQFASNLEVA